MASVLAAQSKSREHEARAPQRVPIMAIAKIELSSGSHARQAGFGLWRTREQSIKRSLATVVQNFRTD